MFLIMIFKKSERKSYYVEKKNLVNINGTNFDDNRIAGG